MLATDPVARRSDRGSDLSSLLRRHAEPLPSPADAAAFGERFDRFGEARIVLLGEATHGTSQFYRARAAISRHLIEHHGFSLVAVEADWPDAARIDDYVRHRAPRPRRGDVFARFPTWMWRNLELLEFADWLRAYNAARDGATRVGFHGLDLYSLSESIHAVLVYLDRVDPGAAIDARTRYGCLTPWQDEPAAYGRAATQAGATTCEARAVAQLQALLARRLAYLHDDGDAWFDAVQNARIVRAAETYYRAMYRSSTDSWNLRDRHMFATLQVLLAHRGDASKAIVWAHNSHVGNAAATAMGWHGEFNIGELCRMAYGDEAVLIGFGTDSGTVAAASDWGGDMAIKTVRPARTDSYEHAFHQVGLARFLVDWRGPGKADLVAALQAPLLERAIGVIYRPETERASHYFEAVMAEQFDAFVWFDETSAVTALGPEHMRGAPEMWPFGL